MLQPVKVMLARWPVLYPEITDVGEQEDDGPGEADSVRREVIVPILESEDMFRTFGEMREEYTRWRDYLAWTEQDLESVMAQENRFDDALVATFEDHRGLLGDPAVKAGLENVRLRKIVRRSVIPHREAWPEESWELIAHLMTSRELCNAGHRGVPSLRSGEEG